MFFAPLKSRQRAKIWDIGASKTRHRIHIKITMPNSSQEPPASSEAPNQDLKDMDVLCTFKINREQKTGNWVYQRSVTISKSRSECQTPVRNIQPSPNLQIRTLKSWMFFGPSESSQSQNLELGCTEDQFLYQNSHLNARNVQCPPNPQITTLRTWMLFAPFK